MMRNLALLLVVATVAIPALAGRHVTVRQLDQELAEVKNKPDQEVVRWLSSLELTERMSTQRLLRWKDAMPGTQSWQALTALADSSVFLNLPSEEIPPAAPLDQNAQQQLLSLASAYVENTLSKLPNFFATQAITTFEDTPAARDGLTSTSYQPLHYSDFMSATVLYRGGKEVMETHKGEVVEQDQTFSGASGLLSSGEFGPVLSTVLTDGQKGKLKWSHWETGATSPMAVFRYAVPQGKSHYKVKVILPGYSEVYQVRPAYHGEIAVDPSSGTILRLTLRADLDPDDPMSKADLMVEYGSVEIGGQKYVCPVKSVALVMAYQQISSTSKMTGDASHGLSNPDSNRRDSPLQTLLNDVAFEHYHVLRSEARILTGADTEDEKNTP